MIAQQIYIVDGEEMLFVKSKVFVLDKIKLFFHNECSNKQANGDAKLEDNETIPQHAFARFMTVTLKYFGRNKCRKIKRGVAACENTDQYRKAD